MVSHAESPGVRVLLCFNEKPTAQMVIRSAARLAVERNAELYALYVEPPGASTRRTPESAAQLAQNQRLARDLGAQVTVLRSHRVADTILAFAHEHAIDVIVLGRSQHTRWQRLFGGDIVERVIAGSDGIDIRVIAQL
jgi:two-component system sensor histidine kinase KdpD